MATARIMRLSLKSNPKPQMLAWHVWLRNSKGFLFIDKLKLVFAVLKMPLDRWRISDNYILFCFFLAVLDPRVGHTMDVLSPFISVLCHSDWLIHGESCPRLDVVHPGRAWSSSPACTWHCSLHYLFLRATPLFPHGVTYMLVSLFWQCLTVPSLLQLC